MSVTGLRWGSVVRGAAVRGEVGTVGNVDIVPKLIRSDCGWGCCSGIPVSPRIVTGDWGDGSNVVAHIVSLVVSGISGICAG